MIRRAFLAAILALGAAPARAASDPAAVAAVETFLRDDEKSILAGVLADQAPATEFNADVKFAAGDAKIMKLVLDKWRGRIVAYAEGDARIANPNPEGTYKNYGALMTPQIRAFLLRRLKTMTEDDRNELIEYLDKINSALASNDNHLTWYTKRVVSGIFDVYRKDLTTYLPTPIAKDAKIAAPAAARTLADLRRAAETIVAVPPVLVPEPPARSSDTVSGSTGGVSIPDVAVSSSSSTSALDQARSAAEAAERAGAVFDGDGAAPSETDGVAAGGGSARTPLEPSSRPEAPSLTAEVPSPVDSDDDFMSSIKQMKTGAGKTPIAEYIAVGGSALLGGLIGFLLGGPIGALIGAGAGLIGGDLAAGMLFK